MKAVEALATGDLTFDPKALRRFSDDAAMLIDATAALGARASNIPTGDLTALQAVAESTKALADSFVSLGAVPALNGAGLAASSLGSAGGGVIIGSLSIDTGGNGDPRAIADMVLAEIDRRIGSRR